MKTMKHPLYTLAVLCAAALLAACSGSDDAPFYPAVIGGTTGDAKFTDKTYGTKAVAASAALGEELEAANDVIGRAALTAEQESYLKAAFARLVDAVIVPTYTSLADNAEQLEQTLNGLNASNITQAQIDEACTLFGKAREQWELSEAFLGGAASDFSIDPTIDSWPLSRSGLLNYFNSPMKATDLAEADESILGFHALEFILLRNGKPRKVSDFQANDTYDGFTGVSGEKELRYAQQVCRLLKERTFQLQVAWQGVTPANASRAAVVQNAGLDILTTKGYSFGDNLKNAGDESRSTFATIKNAVEQLLSAEEGSAYAITNEVGTAKIGHPFTEGIISYVESPYSYRSIIDFQDNIRSVRNVWLGTLNGSEDAGVKSFHGFFSALRPATDQAVTAACQSAVAAIGAMPSPFVKYCCTVWGKTFSEEEYSEE